MISDKEKLVFDGAIKIISHNNKTIKEAVKVSCDVLRETLIQVRNGACDDREYY